ncbi:TIGR03085 family metal-binding protein [Nocardioides sp. CN2-186]|uniref:TIGR03085 family metal-binding protein n=1 Tax=Nocardioides tweenelious TaxID=3156607 RepID=UPI0032B50C40
MTTSLARRERIALCDLALVLGEDAPTLCSGWDARDLVAHLLLREHRPLAGAGITIGAMSRFTDRQMARYRQQDFGVLVEKLRTPGFTPFAIPAVERLANTMEYVVHHEDLRRGQPDWQPRDLDPADDQELWAMLRKGASFAGRKLPVPTVIRRAGTDEVATAKKGEGTVTITGAPVELVLFLFGRSCASDLVFDGPDDAVAAVRNADLGI